MSLRQELLFCVPVALILLTVMVTVNFAYTGTRVAWRDLLKEFFKEENRQILFYSNKKYDVLYENIGYG